MKKTLIVSALLLASSFASAQQSGFYVGGSIGQAKADVGDEAASAIVESGGRATSSSNNETDFSYKIFGGYKVNKNFAVEGGYADLGKYKSSATGTIDTRPISASGDAKNYAIFVDAVGILPASEELSVFGKVGFAYTNTEVNATASMAGFSASESESAGTWVPKLGLGAQYYLTKTIALRAEYEYYFNVGDQDKTGESDVQVLSAGITFGF